MKKSSLIGIIMGAAGLVVITSGIAGMYGYNKASEKNAEKSVNEVISDNNKSSVNNNDTNNSSTSTSEANDKFSSSNQQSANEIKHEHITGYAKEETTINTNKNDNQSSESNNLKSSKKIYNDKLDIANQQAEQIDNRLETDGSLVQGQMNGLAAQKYRLYDDILNEMYQYLQKNLPTDKAKQLKDAQINWIEYKEKEIKAAWPQQDGSMGPLVMNSEGASLTKERCYTILDTYFE